MSDNPFEDKGSSGGANPFAEPAAGKGGGGGEFHNPFEQPAPAAQVAVASGGVSGGSAYETAPAPTSTFGAYDTGAYGGSAGAYGAGQPGAPKAFNPTPVPPSNGEATVRVRELDDRERVLDDRERELARREAELVANGGLKKKNYPFPGCFVFVYHSIQDDIPEDKKPAVKMAHYAFVITVTALCWNFLAATAAMFMFQSVMGWLMAAIYLGAGVPLAWILWYRRIYSACKHDSALGFLWFFIVFLVHIGFCIYAFTGMSSTPYSLTGIENWRKASEANDGVGVMYLVGLILFGLDIVVSINAIRMVYANFRGSGHTLKAAQEEAKRDAVRQAANNA